MQLESTRVEKFKRIDAIDLPLSDLNILVGSNGSGNPCLLIFDVIPDEPARRRSGTDA
ncbi:hypothetical protein EIB18_13505 [Caulobacter vibrioides]|uniref:hypothetical protein n=1 Tax=Caulobacter vibrioides TaxID=155892 RepID=UPI000F5CA6AC|nr:hypothetical protein [Caulobacter vibrioides]AZH13628.1 hypothetical protein EIB18_13505 [Caulobacter vibrioides]